MIPPFPKPHSIVPRPPRPKLDRLPDRGKLMTLAAAFRCQNGGILLCADREENDGVTKRQIDKIYHIKTIPTCDSSGTRAF
jgi:hypothetical protein